AALQILGNPKTNALCARHLRFSGSFNAYDLSLASPFSFQFQKQVVLVAVSALLPGSMHGNPRTLG
ncbi:MAG: hypothetical protein ABJ056_00530, partial [Halioglobus sp.]